MMTTMSPLAVAVTDAPPRIQAMIEALLREEEAILRYDVGRVELNYAHAQVKMTLTVSLGCHKVRYDEPEAMIP